MDFESDFDFAGITANPDFVSGYVALVGRPNVGKSTLMNRFLDERIAIVTHKPQTTRRKTLGILNGDAYQVILLDTPGIMDPEYSLHRAMIADAMQALRDADLIVLLVDARAPVELIEAIAESKLPCVLAINKIDALKRRDDLLPKLEAYHALGRFEAVVPLSALHGEGVDTLLASILERLPTSPPFYPPDQIAEQPERFFVAEIIRERIFELFEQEVPYSTEVTIEEFREGKPGRKDFIEAVVFAETDSQKMILIGKGGRAIKVLGEEAREAVEAFLGREVFLSLRVKRLPKWRKKKDALRKLGYRG